MCLLTFMPPKINIDYSKAKTAARSNPNGFGFAIICENKIIKDHDMDFEKLWTRWSVARAAEQGPAIFHFRISTHGLTDIDNCHPFIIGQDDKTVMAHNGILPITMPVHDNRSDSKIFAEYVLPEMGGISSLDNEETFKCLSEWATGSKLVFLTVDPLATYDWYIVNEEYGHWAEDMWWSNKSYVTYPITSYSSYGINSRGMYSNIGYDDTYNDDEYWTNPRNQISDEVVPAELQDYLSNELYEDSEHLELIRIFTEFGNSYQTASVTCYECGKQYRVDPFEPSATHCGDCRNCLACGNNKCRCWEDFEYGQSFLVEQLAPLAKPFTLTEQDDLNYE